LRTDRGLTYGAEADLSALEQAGDFVADTDTRTETTGAALRLIVDEINRLQRERVSDRELSDAQAYLAGSFPLTIETPDAIASQILNVLFYGVPLSELETYRERVNAITPEDIQRVARTYLHPDRLSVVLVGNAAGFAPQLKGLGFDNYDVVSLRDLDVTTADLHRPAAPAAPAARPTGPRD
jgi:zinc protease